jgi:ribulose-5-phosphate 4-epimerase/fuculose-1-phosphate aldolase
MATVTDPRIDYRTLIARAIRILNSRGVMHKSGHVAARDAGDPNTMWINSRKASRSGVRAEDIVPVDLRTGERIGTGDEAPSEFHIHRAIFNARPDVGALCHTHPDYVVALSIAGKTLHPVHPVGGFLPESAPLFDDANLVNTEARGEALARVMGESPVVVLRGHGIVVAAKTVEEVVMRTIAAEDNARFQYIASAIGEPKIISGEELEIAARDIMKPVVIRKHWDYNEENARKAGALEGID